MNPMQNNKNQIKSILHIENDIYLDPEKQIENEEYEKDWNFEL